MPLASSARLSRRGGARVELALHQPVHEVDHAHLGAGLGEAVGGLEAEQPAADDDGAGARWRRALDRRDIAEIAEGEHAGQLHARDRQPDRTRAGREHELGVGQRRAVGETDAADVRIDRDRGVAVEQRDAALAPPARGFQLDLGGRDLAAPAPTTAARGCRRAAAPRRPPRRRSGRARGVASSSTNRAAAMPLPMTTRGSLMTHAASTKRWRS